MVKKLINTIKYYMGKEIVHTFDYVNFNKIPYLYVRFYTQEENPLEMALIKLPMFRVSRSNPLEISVKLTAVDQYRTRLEYDETVLNCVFTGDGIAFITELELGATGYGCEGTIRLKRK